MKLRRDILVFYETVWFCTVLTGFNQVLDGQNPTLVFICLCIKSSVIYRAGHQILCCRGVVLKRSGACFFTTTRCSDEQGSR